jgi:DNA-binding NarL/FixJ family response regulator
MLESYLSTNEAPSLLSARERAVIQLIAEGHTYKSIARVLNLSAKTIEMYRATAMHKLSIKTTAGLVRYAIKNMLIEP